MFEFLTQFDFAFTTSMGKRFRRAKSICSCSSPLSSSSKSPRSCFSCYEDDLWTEISKYLDGKSLIMLAMTCKWFYNLIMDDSIWKFVCLRDLNVSYSAETSFSWIHLYASAFDGTHAYVFRQQEKHIDWMRIGAFYLDSPAAFVTDNLICPKKLLQQDDLEKALESSGLCVLTNIKTGIWIADLQLVRCPVCDLDTCEGTMQMLDARHIELFLCEGYQDESWEYATIGSHETKKNVGAACGAIFALKHVKDCSTAGLFNTKTWIGKENDWQPKTKITLHAVAVCTKLQDNEGLHVKYHVMRAGSKGQIMSIRISQQLL